MREVSESSIETRSKFTICAPSDPSENDRVNAAGYSDFSIPWAIAEVFFLDEIHRFDGVITANDMLREMRDAHEEIAQMDIVQVYRELETEIKGWAL